MERMGEHTGLIAPISSLLLLLVQTQAARWKATAPEQLTGAHLYLDIAKSSWGYLFHGYSGGMVLQPRAWPDFSPGMSSITTRNVGDLLRPVPARLGFRSSAARTCCFFWLSPYTSSSSFYVWRRVPSGCSTHTRCTSRCPSIDEGVLSDHAGQNAGYDGWRSTSANSRSLCSPEYWPRCAAAVESLWWSRDIMGST